MKATTFRLLPVLALMLMLGCSDDNVVDPDPQTLPLQGEGTLTMVQAAGMVSCEAPDGTVVGAFPAKFDALADYTTLGRTVGVITVNACTLNPANGTLVIPGEVRQTAASGDELRGTYEAIFAPDFSFSLEVNIVGGTGRFEGASGAASGGGTVDLATGSGTTWLDGEITVEG